MRYLLSAVLLSLLASTSSTAQSTECLTAIEKQVAPQAKIQLLLENNLKITGRFSHVDTLNGLIHLWQDEESVSAEAVEISRVQTLKYHKQGKALAMPIILTGLAGACVGAGFAAASEDQNRSWCGATAGPGRTFYGAVIGTVFGVGIGAAYSIITRTRTVDCRGSR